MDCIAILHLIADHSNLKIVNLIEEHNHEVSAEVNACIPENRKLDKEDQAKTRLLFEAGVKPSTVRPLLRGAGTGKVTQRDLSNLRAKWRREKRGGEGVTENERIGETLEDLLLADPGAFVHIGKTEDSEELTFIFIQTSSMLENVRKFGRVILLDHTYKINANKMPVSVFMVMDGNGEGRSAGYAFVANEQLATVIQVVSAFKEAISEEVANRIRTVVVDKDASEIGAIRRVLHPDVNIQLCTFHVSKTFNEKTHNEKPVVREILTKLRLCEDELEFSSLVNDLKAEASPSLFDYFERNWLHCPQAWSCIDKKCSLNLGNNTTNRVESHNAKIKMMLSYNKTLSEALNGLLAIVKNKEEDVFFRNKMESIKERYITNSDDPIVKVILKDLTVFAAKLLIYEMKQIPPEEILAKYKATNNTCSCLHASSYGLPCRHIMHCRRKSGETLYKREDIHDMWLKEKAGSTLTFPLKGEERNHFKMSVLPARVLPSSANEKYSLALFKAKEICSLMAESGKDEFARRYHLLQELFKLWASGKQVNVVEVLAENMPSDGSGRDVTVEVIDGADDAVNSRCNVTGMQQTSSADDTPCHQDISVGSDFEFMGIMESAAGLEMNDSRNTPEVSLKSSVTASLVKSISDGGNLPSSAAGIQSVESRNIPEVSVQSPAVTASLVQSICDGGNLPSSAAGIQSVERNIPEVSAQSPVTPLLRCMSEGRNTTPMCFCGMPTVRCVSSSFSQRKGRIFYKCSTNVCRFWRLAKKEDCVAGSVPSTDPSGNGLATTVEMPPVSGEENNQHVVCSDLLADDNDNALLQLVDFLDSQENDDVSNESETHPLQIMKTVKLPSVKPRGRPQGNKKSGHSVPLNITENMPRGALVSSHDKMSEAMERRQSRGANISTADVTEREGKWQVVSQTNKSLKYEVTQNDNGFSCTCPDKVNPCKHIHKIMCLVTGPAVYGIKKAMGEVKLPVAAKIKGKPQGIGKTTFSHVKAKQLRQNTNLGVPQDVDNVDSTVVNEDAKAKGPMESSCILCTQQGRPDGSGAHKCAHCGTPVHAFGCSVQVDGEEGAGGSDRICVPCHVKVSSQQTLSQQSVPATQPVKRKLFPTVQELDDEVISESIKILREQFPDIGGWQDPAAASLEYDLAKSFEDTVHVVHDRERSHWVTVIISKMTNGKRVVYVYDSLHRNGGGNNLTDNLQIKIAQMCNETGPTITVVYPPCQQQKPNDRKSCGYFAVANAIEYGESRKIRSHFFKTNDMSKHLTECLQNKKFTPFPKDPQSFKSPGRVSKKEYIQVYCYCRLPQCYDIKTVVCENCSEWYHFKCVGLNVSPGSWVCSKEDCVL